MPHWDEKKKRYVEEEMTLPINRERREEEFRTALLNELAELVHAVRCLDRGAS